MYPIRVLHIVGKMSPGGIETMIMNVYRNIDREKVQFDFLIHKGDKGLFSEEIASLGGKEYVLPKIRDNEKVYYYKLPQYIWSLIKFFKAHKEYKIIHGHMTNTASIYIPIARWVGEAKCCIVHSHSTSLKPGLMRIVTKVLHTPLKYIADEKLACSEAAARWIFSEEDIKSEKVIIINNGVDLQKFKYNDVKRKEIREYWGVADKIVIGHVGRFKKEKNQDLLIEMMRFLQEWERSYVLMLVGDGELKENLEKKMRTLNLENKVIFTGVQKDISDIMQAFDIFVLPSLFEGLPVVAIEAQANGLPCFIAETVTKEVDITGNVCFINSTIDAKIWAEKIICMGGNYKRICAEKEMSRAGYDIKETAVYLQNFYLERSI
jgi:glycosyltransferase involved in cell wall biosynthesis